MEYQVTINSIRTSLKYIKQEILTKAQLLKLYINCILDPVNFLQSFFTMSLNELTRLIKIKA